MSGRTTTEGCCGPSDGLTPIEQLFMATSPEARLESLIRMSGQGYLLDRFFKAGDPPVPWKNEDVSKLSLPDLLEQRETLRSWYRQRPTGWSAEDVVNLFVLITQELRRRRAKADLSPSDPLDLAARPFLRTFSLVESSGEVLGPPLILQEVLASFGPQNIVLDPSYIRFLGEDESSDALRFLVRDLSDAPPALLHVIRWRLFRMLPPSTRPNIYLNTELTEEGEPLFALELERCQEDVLVEMSKKDEWCEAAGSFRLRLSYVTMVGGLVARGKTEGDIDLLIRESPFSPPHFRQRIADAVVTQLPEAMRSRVQVSFDHFYGPFTDHVPLYHLTLRRLPETLKSLPWLSKVKEDRQAFSEAEASRREDKVLPGRMIHTFKPVKPAFPEERQTVEAFMKVVEQEGKPPFFVQKKYDGTHSVILKNGEQVDIITEDGEVITPRLPQMVKEVQALPVKALTLDAEIESWSKEGQHQPREVTAGYLFGHGEADDSQVVANVFDVALLQEPSFKLPEKLKEMTGDLHQRPQFERLALLEEIPFSQSTNNSPDSKKKLNRAPTIKVESAAGLREQVEKLRFLPGSEGVVIKYGDRPFPLSGQARVSVKFHNSAALVGMVYEIQPTKVQGVYNYLYGLLPSGLGIVRQDLTRVGSVTLAKIGKTFSTAEKVPVGGLIEVEFETFNLVKDHRLDGFTASAWVPRFIRHVTDRSMPDSVATAVKEAEKNRVLVRKEIQDGATTVLPDGASFEKEVIDLPVLKMPDPAFNLKRLAEGKPTGLLSRLDRSSRVGQKQLLINESKGPDSVPKAFGIITLAQGVSFPSCEQVPENLMAGVDQVSVEEFHPLKESVFYYPMVLLERFAAPILLSHFPSGRRFGPSIVIRKAKEAPSSDPFLLWPDETKSYRYVCQRHFRGRTAHVDFRYELPNKRALLGFTINDQIPGAIKEPVTTIAQARALNAEAERYFKIDFNTGEWAQRRKKGAGEVVNVMILSERKAAEPSAWISVEGVTDAGEVGGTRNYPGVFLVVSQGRLSYGAVKPWLHEYYPDGKGFNYRIFFRRLKIDFASGLDPGLMKFVHLQTDLGFKLGSLSPEDLLMDSFDQTILEEAIIASNLRGLATKALVIPATEEPFLRKEPGWFLIKPLDQTPYVLSNRAVSESWVPPSGQSALPSEVRRVVPAHYRYWTLTDNSAILNRRNELVVALKKGEVTLPLYGQELKKAQTESDTSRLQARFVLQYQWFKGPKVIREGPSRQYWDVRLDVGDEKVWRFRLDGDPRQVGQTVGQFEIDPKSFMGITGYIKPGAPLNDTKDTPSWIERLDAGSAVVLVDRPNLKKVQFRGRQLKGTWMFVRRDSEWAVSRESEAPRVE